MRDIRFRVWTGTHWLKPMEMAKMLMVGSSKENWGQFSYGSNEISEYTGLKDKNGVEIYEGDIVNCFYPNEVKTMQVIFNQDTVSFEFKGEEVYDSLVNADNFEVIGNIYENPELLTQGSDLADEGRKPI